MEVTFLSSVVREALETSLNRHAQAYHLLAMKTAALKQAGDFCVHALAKAWARKILKSCDTTASRSADRVRIVKTDILLPRPSEEPTAVHNALLLRNISVSKVWEVGL